MATIRFHQVSEFLDELRKDRGKVDRGIVRMAFRHTKNPPLTTLTLVASAVVAGHVVTLERRCGEFMFADGPDSKPVQDRGDEFADMVKQACAEMNLEVRSGVFEAAA